MHACVLALHPSRGTILVTSSPKGKIEHVTFVRCTASSVPFDRSIVGTYELEIDRAVDAPMQQGAAALLELTS
jgi:hypothetical protein